ncbi:MAG: L-histidine N(alpha)-methyltransferase [Cyanobacteria bacterium P01_A01_bin.45]
MNFNFEELLADSVSERDLGWTLCFIGGEDQSKKLTELTKHLRKGFSESGDGKEIPSGFAYWGITPTIAWAYACNDPLYLVMKEGIDSFEGRWRKIQSKLDINKYHYVSLGVGTGMKDKSILRFFLNTNPELLYFPVDMSSEMLRFGVQGVSKGLQIKGSQILPIQIDFSKPEGISDLRKLLDRVLDDKPILFSLLGNTLANFYGDIKVLQTLSKLMHSEDRFLIEVAVTKDLSHQSLQDAATEYNSSKSFKEFVTSSLLQHTDLDIDLNSVFFESSLEKPDKAILLKALYRNITGKSDKVMLLDRSTINFPDRDTIRLLLTRKYTHAGIDKVVSESKLSIIDRINTLLEPYNSSKFGMDLILLAPSGDVSKDEKTLADAVWKN